MDCCNTWGENIGMLKISFAPPTPQPLMAHFFICQQKVAKMRLATGNEKSVNLHLLEDQTHLASWMKCPTKIWKIGCENPLKTCANIQSFLRIKKSISRTHVAWCRNNVVSELAAQCPMSVAWMSSWAAVMVCPDGWNLRWTRLAMVWKENVAILLFLNMPFTFSLVKVL